MPLSSDSSYTDEGAVYSSEGLMTAYQRAWRWSNRTTVVLFATIRTSSLIESVNIFRLMMAFYT
jgi:hypothetical protein